MHPHLNSVPARDDRSCLSAVKLYIGLVLIPQLLWAVSHATAGGYAYLSFCESCVPPHLTTNPSDTGRSEGANSDVAVMWNTSAVDFCTCRFDHYGASPLEGELIAPPTDPHGGW